MTKDRNKIIDTIVANITDVDKPAIETFTGEVLTYGALVKFIELTQATLEQFNIKPHQRIGFISDNPLTFPVLLGIIETATFAALNSTWKRQLTARIPLEIKVWRMPTTPASSSALRHWRWKTGWAEPSAAPE